MKAPTHDSRAHAPLPPSASNRWLACPPSQGYIKALIRSRKIQKRQSGEAAKRGTRIHELADVRLLAILQGRKPRAFAKSVDKEEAVEAQAYIDYCVDRWEGAKLLDDSPRFGVEEKSRMTKNCWGRADFWFLSAGRLTVIDLKTGREGVEAKDNTQLMIYALGVLRTHKIEADEIEVCVWQPNADDSGPPERSHVYARGEFIEHVKRLVAGEADAAKWLTGQTLEKMVPALNAGSHCTWCDALGVCPAAKRHNLQTASASFAPVPVDDRSPPDPVALGPEEVAQVLSRSPEFVKWIEAIKDRALELMCKGHTVPGYKVVPKVTRRAFDKKYTPGQIAKGLGLTVSAITTSKVMSPAQVEAILPKAKRERLSRFVFKPPGEPTIARETDRREALPNAKLSFTPVSYEEDDDA